MFDTSLAVFVNHRKLTAALEQDAVAGSGGKLARQRQARQSNAMRKRVGMGIIDIWVLL